MRKILSFVVISAVMLLVAGKSFAAYSPVGIWEVTYDMITIETIEVKSNGTWLLWGYLCGGLWEVQPNNYVILGGSHTEGNVEDFALKQTSTTAMQGFYIQHMCPMTGWMNAGSVKWKKIRASEE